MIGNGNYQKLEAIFKKNGGFITREDVDKAGVNSWFLSDFVRKNIRRMTMQSSKEGTQNISSQA